MILPMILAISLFLTYSVALPATTYSSTTMKELVALEKVETAPNNIMTNNALNLSSQHNSVTEKYEEDIIAGIVAAGNDVIVVDNVATMKTTDLQTGMFVATGGYYNVNDGGCGVYAIRRATLTDVGNGGSIIILDNGNVAELINNGIVNIKQFGAVGDGVTSDTISVQNAVNFSEFVAFPPGTYLLNTINISSNKTIYAETRATIKLDYSANNCTFATVFDVDGCELNVKGFDFVGTAKPSPVLGTYPIPHVLYGENGGTINVENCSFNTVQHTQGVSQGSVLNGQVGTLLTTFDCDVSFKHIRIINCYGELTHCHHTVATVDDIEKDSVFEDIYMENNTGTINCMARNLIVKHFRGSHTIYNGSIVNAFGIKNILLEDIDVASNASNPVDTTEGGLIRCEKIVVKDVPTLTKVYGEEIEIYNSNVVNSRVNRQNNAWSPYSVKSNPSKCNIYAHNSTISQGEMNVASIADVSVNYVFENCVLAKRTFIGSNAGITTRDIYIKCINTAIYGGQFCKGTNTYINCELINDYCQGYNHYLVGDANATSGVSKTDEYVRFIDCWAVTEITLYTAWGINGNDYYNLQACDNIINPYSRIKINPGKN